MEDQTIVSSSTIKNENPPPSTLLIVVDVLIVGGGLSGVLIAHELEQQRQSAAKMMNYRLVDARSVLGGRLINDTFHDDIDLGGTWIWPQYQPYINQLVAKFGLSTIEQYPDDLPSSSSSSSSSSSQQDTSTHRIAGGAIQLVRRLAESIPEENIQLNTPVCSCKLISEGQPTDGNGESGHTSSWIRVETTTKDNVVFKANKVVLAVPPKLIDCHIRFDPPLSPSKQQAIKQSKTWMAGVTKVALEYSHPFWKDSLPNMKDYYGSTLWLAGIGRIQGPAFQIYDASTDKVHALTAFTLATGIPDDKALADKVSEQLQTLWNRYFTSDVKAARLSQAIPSYTRYHVQRWPLEPYISEDPHPTTIQPHPQPVLALSTTEWDNRLLFAGTESDSHSPGVMEGAIRAARRVLKQL